MLFIDNQFDRIQNTQRAIQILKRFERLDLPNLDIQDKYARVLSHYSKDIETVSKIYNKSRQQPPIARDLPPISGKILWVRQLYRRINQPMRVFEATRTILTHPDARRIVKNYNQLSAVLIEYELLHHRMWLRQVELVMSGVHASLLVKGTDMGEYLVNFDPEIMTLIRETECMKRLKLEIPPEADELVLRQELFKQHYNKLKFLVDENKRLRGKIPPSFEQLLIPRLQSLDQTFAPGCISLTWVSSNIDDYSESVQRALDSFELVLQRAEDLVTYRIEAVLSDVATSTLCEIADDEPMSVEAFYRRTEELCAEVSLQLQSKSANVEEATEELIELLYPAYKYVPICLLLFCDHFIYNFVLKRQTDEFLAEEENEANNAALLNGTIKSLDGSTVKSLTGAAKTPLTQSQIALKKKREHIEAMHEAAYELFLFFNHKNLDALVRLFRSTLEKLRRRITASQAISAYNEDKVKGEENKK